MTHVHEVLGYYCQKNITILHIEYGVATKHRLDAALGKILYISPPQ